MLSQPHRQSQSVRYIRGPEQVRSLKSLHNCCIISDPLKFSCVFFIRINKKFCILSGYTNDISLIISDVKHRIASSQATRLNLRNACSSSAIIARVNSSRRRFCFGNSFQTHVGIFRQHVVFFFDMSYTEIYSKDPK